MMTLVLDKVKDVRKGENAKVNKSVEKVAWWMK